jgi:nucleoside-diphosphate-sugar epimerase
MPLAAITGATGFIGAVITRQLQQSGWAVRALVRAPGAGRRLEARGIQVVPGALSDPAALAALVTGVDAVIHCAGAVRGANWADFAAVNVDGTANLLQALDGRSAAVVLLSSLAAREPGLSHYARSKRTMEDLLQGAGAPGECLVLRPPAVYGPGDRELMPLFNAMARGFAPLPAPQGARASMLYVDDLARAVLAWLMQARRSSGTFELHDGQPGGYSWEEIVGIAESLLGRRIRKLRLPDWLLGNWAGANLGLARVLRYAPMLTPGKLRELRHPDWVCDNASLRAVLDWQPRVRLREGLQLTCGWGRPHESPSP